MSPVPTGPYRDENASLRADLARLRAQRSWRMGPRAALAIALVPVEFGAVVLLRPWLNGASDTKLAAALAALAMLAAAALAAAYGSWRNDH